MLTMLLFATILACVGLALMCRIADRPSEGSTTMSRPKPGEEITYSADVERTGIVLDRGPSPMTYDYKSQEWKPLDYRVWVHREDGTFDLVKVMVSGKRAGETTWIERRTAGGGYLRAGEKVA
jgi:hypothetical protein